MTPIEDTELIQIISYQPWRLLPSAQPEIAARTVPRHLQVSYLVGWNHRRPLHLDLHATSRRARPRFRATRLHCRDSSRPGRGVRLLHVCHQVHAPTR